MRDAQMHTTEQKWTVALLKILDDMNAPDYAFNKIISWASQAKTDGYSFEPEGGLSRRGNLEQLFATTKNARSAGSASSDQPHKEKRDGQLKVEQWQTVDHNDHCMKSRKQYHWLCQLMHS